MPAVLLFHSFFLRRVEAGRVEARAHLTNHPRQAVIHQPKALKTKKFGGCRNFWRLSDVLHAVVELRAKKGAATPERDNESIEKTGTKDK